MVLMHATRRSSWNCIICCWKPRPTSPMCTGDRHPHVLEVELARVGAPVADLVEQLVAEARRVGGNHDLREAAVAGVGIGHRQQAQPVGRGGVGDVGLAAVDHPVVAVADGARLDPGHVGARLGLRHGDGAHHLARDRRNQVLLPQIVAPELVQRRRRHVGLDADPHGDAGVAAADQLLEEDRRERPVEAGPAPLRVVAQAQHPEVAHLLVQALVEAPGLVELARPRRDLLLCKLARRGPEGLVLGCVEEVLACHALGLRVCVGPICGG